MPTPNGFIKPYFNPIDAGLPNKLKPAPIVAPSAPNLNLFLNLAAAKSVPDNPSVSSSFKTMFPLPGSVAKKSVIPNAVAITPDFDAMFVAVVPTAATLAAFAFLAKDNFLSLFVILKPALPGTPYCVNTSTTLPVKASGSFNLFSS